MGKLAPMSGQFQHFLTELRETFWGDLHQQTRLAWKSFFQVQSERERDRYWGFTPYQRGRSKQDSRNGYYERDYVTRLGTLRLRVARTRKKNFLPPGIARFSRRVEVRRRTRPMVCFVNVESVDRIFYSIFHRFNLDWRTRTLRLFTQAA